jgi:hypothetical protein
LQKRELELRKAEEAKHQAEAKAEEAKRADDLALAREEARKAQEAVRRAEAELSATIEAANRARKAAEEAAKQAEKTIDLKRDKHTNVAAVPKRNHPNPKGYITGRPCTATTCGQVRAGCLRIGRAPSDCASKYSSCLASGMWIGLSCNYMGLARR